MAGRSIHDLDLSPRPGKQYWKNGGREWREELIYFLMVDRFHDDHDRKPVANNGRSRGYGGPEQLQKSCRGTLRGITKNLDYIKDLGCTALWLSPVFENNEDSYHGYAIQDYTEIDKRFGSKQDLPIL